MCVHCKQPVVFQPSNLSWQPARWTHVREGDNEAIRCYPDDSSRREQRAKPVRWCDERMQGGISRYGEVCNRPVKEFGKCGIHMKDAKQAWEQQQKIDELVEQDKYVEDTLGSVITVWNEKYDLDARLDVNANHDSYDYRRGKVKYTGYVVVNPGRLASIMASLEEEFT
jgi:hypothetical protein